jgi:hypothetical protein
VTLDGAGPPGREFPARDPDAVASERGIMTPSPTCCRGLFLNVLAAAEAAAVFPRCARTHCCATLAPLWSPFCPTLEIAGTGYAYRATARTRTSGRKSFF